MLTDGAMGLCTAWQQLDIKGMPVNSSVPSHEHQYIAWVLVSTLIQSSAACTDPKDAGASGVVLPNVR